MHGNIYWQALKRRQSYCHVVIFINTNTVNKRFARLSTTERTFSGPITENFNVMNLKEVISSPLCKLLQSHTWKYGLKDESILVDPTVSIHVFLPTTITLSAFYCSHNTKSYCTKNNLELNTKSLIKLQIPLSRFTLRLRIDKYE